MTLAYDGTTDRLISAGLFQGLWWLAVLSARQDPVWFATGLLLLFAAARLLLAWRAGVPGRRLLAGWIGTALLGASLDSLLIGLGGLALPTAALPGLPLPAWMLGLWAGFAALLPGPLAALSTRPWLAAGLGALGGPASYAAAAGVGAASFPAGDGPVLLALALIWAPLLPLLARLGAGLRPACSTPGAGRSAAGMPAGQCGSVRTASPGRPG
jgi:hypothetical protein